jgi:hypothetical protein
VEQEERNLVENPRSHWEVINENVDGRKVGEKDR